MDTRLALLKSISDNPTDTTIRLVYADWLDENNYNGMEWRLEDPPFELNSDDTGSGSGNGSGSGIGDGGDGSGGDGSGSGIGGDGGDGSGIGDGGDGSGIGDGDGSGGDGSGGNIKHSRRFFMPNIGDKILVHSRGSYYPYVWCGEVLEIVGPRCYILGNASQLPHTRITGVTWAGVAQGRERDRQEVRIRVYQNPVEVMDVCYCTKWVGELPTKDQH